MSDNRVRDNVSDDLDVQTLPDEFDSCIGMSLADAMREGSKETEQVFNWGDGVSTACALTAAGMVVQRKGFGINK